MWRSLVAHLFWEQRVAGSNPVIPTDQSRSDHMIRAALSFLAASSAYVESSGLEVDDLTDDRSVGERVECLIELAQ